jgi:hypothetical protein
VLQLFIEGSHIRVSNLKILIDKLSAGLLIITGMLGITLAVADFAGWEKLILASKNPLTMILGFIALLSLSLGLERVIHFQSIDRQFESLKSLLARSSGAQHLKNYEEIYNTAIKLCGLANQQIRTVLFNPRPLTTPKTPQEWAQAIARRLRDSRKSKKPVTLEAVIAVDFNFLKATDMDPFKERYNVYKKIGVSDLYKPRLLNTINPIGLDVFIIDRKHVILAFTMAEGLTDLQRGILFEDQPMLASEFADWFDQQIFRRAVPLDKWLKEYKNQEISEWA